MGFLPHFLSTCSSSVWPFLLFFSIAVLPIGIKSEQADKFDDCSVSQSQLLNYESSTPVSHRISTRYSISELSNLDDLSTADSTPVENASVDERKELDLSGRELRGVLQLSRDSQRKFRKLLRLSLAYNELYGNPFPLLRCSQVRDLPLRAVFPKLKVLYMSNNQLTNFYVTHSETDGERRTVWIPVDLSALPARLQLLELSHNHFGGFVSLDSLPETLELLDLSHNHFQGMRSGHQQLDNGIPIITFAGLPHSLKHLYLNDNQLVGNVDLSTLPPRLRVLSLAHNALTGGVDLTRLPSTLQKLDLSFNELVGHVDLSQLPESLEYVSLGFNKLGSPCLGSGSQLIPGASLSLPSPYCPSSSSSSSSSSLPSESASASTLLTHLPPRLKTLDLSHNKLRGGPVDLTQLPPTLATLQLSDNRLQGSVNLTHLPPALRYLDLSRNQLTGRLVYPTTETEGDTRYPSSPSLPLLMILSLSGNRWSCPVPKASPPGIPERLSCVGGGGFLRSAGGAGGMISGGSRRSRHHLLNAGS